PFNTVTGLKGQFKFTGSGVWLRQSLVVAQFAVSILLIICTILLQQQMSYIQQKKLGYQKEKVLVLPADRLVNKKYEVLKGDLLRQANVQSVSRSYETPVKIDGGYSISVASKEVDNRPVTAIPISEDFLETLNMQLLTGQPLNKTDMAIASRVWEDSTAEMPVLINEALAQSLGWTAQSAVGQFVEFRGARNPIKGVVADFHFSSLHEVIKPLVLFPEDYGRVILVRLGNQQLDQTFADLETIWGKIVMHRPFSYHFMDEEFDQMYTTEIRTTSVVTTFAWLAIFLACLGLFGLASYNFVQRTKEIGVRKVLGASTLGIVGLLSKDFLKLVLVALLLAAPVAWYFMTNWLKNFNYRIDIAWWVIPLAGIVAVLIAFLTVSVQGVRAALANPIESLRSE
ncbi:MAG: FtsX-like permease family protein, partial [Bacteroidota bacterium]